MLETWNVYLEFVYIVNGVILVIWNALERYQFCLLIASEWGKEIASVIASSALCISHHDGHLTGRTRHLYKKCRNK